MRLFKKIKLYYDRIIDISSSDLDDARRRKLLNIILMGMISVAITLVPLVTISMLMSVIKPNEAIPAIVALLIAIAGITTIYFINRSRSGKFASTAFLLLLMFIISIADSPEELANGRSVFLFVIPIIVSSVLIGSNSTFIFYIVSSVEIIILVQYTHKPVTESLFPIISFFFLTIISWLSARSLEDALRDLRTINANLDALVTERTRALLDALSRERFESGRSQAILNSIADGVIVFDADNKSILANPALSRLTNTNLQDLVGIDAGQFISMGNISRENSDMMMEFIGHPEKNISAFRIDWGKNTFSTSIASVQVSKHEHIGTVIVFRDITQEAQLERMKDNFVAIISHELRTPLNAIMGHAEMMKEAVFGALNESQLSAMERIMVNVNRLLSMVGDLLDEAQIRAGKLSVKPQVFEISSLLENLHNSMDKTAADKRLSLVGRLGDGIPAQIVGDPQRIQQILFNLVGNAIKFTEHGYIDINIDRADAEHWKMEVTDQGIGIPEEELPYIFDTFRQASSEVSTRRHGGFGLGLSIVKQLVELMGGNIHVKSESQRGSTFIVTLPLRTSL